jgi:energy-coupling factor transporter ATP-binding protein EcfA2
METRQIKAIKVSKLFGQYSYRLPENGSFSDAAILYGDNGVGKSTILRIVYHLLSAADNRGHRSALLRLDFQELEVELSSGVNLSARKCEEDSIPVLKQSIKRDGHTLAEWDFFPTNRNMSYSEDEAISRLLDGNPDTKMLRRFMKNRKVQGVVPQGKVAFLHELQKHVPMTFILNAERRLNSDSVPDPSDEMELRKFMHYESPKTINDLVVRSREIALSQALGAASKWIGTKAIIGANQGSTNVHTVYIDVLSHVMSAAGNPQDQYEETAVKDLDGKLERIENKIKEHAQYELGTRLSTVEFRRALRSRQRDRGYLAATLLKPYIESLEKRLEAIEPTYQVIDTFVTTVNSFLRDKELRYKVSQGFGIWNRLGDQLPPASLSSGEQQLLLLFCYVLTARDNPSIFMIDEPEISLNIKWQRQLVKSLLLITQGSEIQFLFASHSMELLSQHSERVVQLVDRP